jgi:hypothetical protein
METNLAGVYAAGDIGLVENEVSMNLMANNFGKATVAVGYASRFVHPQARVVHGHSSQRKGMRYAPTPVGPAGGQAAAESLPTPGEPEHG